MRIARFTILVPLLSFSISNGVTYAGIITGSNAFTTQGSTATVSNINRNARTLDINKTFNGLEPIDIEFNVQNSGGTSEWKTNEFVKNNSGAEWRDFHFELGIGTGIGFVRFSANNLFMFSNPPTANSVSIDVGAGVGVLRPFEESFGTNSALLEYISTSGSGVLSNPINILRFPNLSIQIPDGIDKFTLRETPTTDGKRIPEPSTILLTFLGLAGLFVFNTGRLKFRR